MDTRVLARKRKPFQPNTGNTEDLAIMVKLSQTAAEHRERVRVVGLSSHKIGKIKKMADRRDDPSWKMA